MREKQGAEVKDLVTDFARDICEMLCAAQHDKMDRNTVQYLFNIISYETDEFGEHLRRRRSAQ